MAGKPMPAYGPQRCADIADKTARNQRQRRHQEHAGDAIATHFQLIANTAATAAGEGRGPPMSQ